MCNTLAGKPTPTDAHTAPMPLPVDTRTSKSGKAAWRRLKRPIGAVKGSLLVCFAFVAGLVAEKQRSLGSAASNQAGENATAAPAPLPPDIRCAVVLTAYQTLPDLTSLECTCANVICE